MPGLIIDRLRRQYDSRIARVYARVFYVFRDHVDFDLPMLGDRVQFDLFDLLKELWDGNGMLRGYRCSSPGVLLQLLASIADIHGITREDIWRPHQDRIPYAFSKAGQPINVDEGIPCRLADIQRVEQLRKLAAIFRLVDMRGTGPQDGYTVVMQGFYPIIGSLPTYRDNHTIWRLKFTDVGYTLKGEFFKVQAVGCIIVRWNRFWITVNHDGAFLVLFKRLYCTNACPVKFYRWANTIGTRAENDDSFMPGWGSVMMLPIVGHIEIIRIRGIFGGQGIDLKDRWRDAQFFAQSSYLQTGFACKLSNTFVWDTQLLQCQESRGREILACS